MITSWGELSFFMVVSGVLAYLARVLAAMLSALAVYVKNRWTP